MHPFRQQPTRLAPLDTKAGLTRYMIQLLEPTRSSMNKMDPPDPATQKKLNVKLGIQSKLSQGPKVATLIITQDRISAAKVELK